MCRVVDTVLIDQETVYAPRHGNDRLLLGLKGSLNEYELDLLRQRSLSTLYDIDPDAAKIVLVVHWCGGVHREMRLPGDGAATATAPPPAFSPPCATSR